MSISTKYNVVLRIKLNRSKSRSEVEVKSYQVSLIDCTFQDMLAQKF